MENSDDNGPGAGGIGSGRTGGDHVFHNMWLVLGVSFAIGAALVSALAVRPLSVVVFFSPVLVFGWIAWLLHRRGSRVFFVFWILAMLAGLIAVLALCAPESEV